jgi:atrophin-1 interacting protein 5 (WW domain-containing E3 ubiquitin protein ligase 1)
MSAQEAQTARSNAGVDEEQMRLPPGWEKKVNDSGEVWYVDHASKEGTQQPPPAQELGPLPSGWNIERNPGGVGYFVDHNTRSTTWLDPRGPQQSG